MAKQIDMTRARKQALSVIIAFARKELVRLERDGRGNAKLELALEAFKDV